MLSSMGKRKRTYSVPGFLALIGSVVALISHGLAGAQPQPPAKKTPFPGKKPAALKPKANPDAERLVKVATLQINDGAAARVRETFKTAKIPVMVMGQRMYGVLVKKKDRDRAIRLLKADAKKQRYWVQFH